MRRAKSISKRQLSEKLIPKEVKHMAKDPVCKMSVDEKTAQYTSEYKGTTYYFCAPSCKATFDKNPAKYASSSSGHGGHGCCCGNC